MSFVCSVVVSVFGERCEMIVCGYLGGVGVAVSSTNRGRVNHRAGFAL